MSQNGTASPPCFVTSGGTLACTLAPTTSPKVDDSANRVSSASRTWLIALLAVCAGIVVVGIVLHLATKRLRRRRRELRVAERTMRRAFEDRLLAAVAQIAKDKRRERQWLDQDDYPTDINEYEMETGGTLAVPLLPRRDDSTFQRDGPQDWGEEGGHIADDGNASIFGTAKHSLHGEIKDGAPSDSKPLPHRQKSADDENDDEYFHHEYHNNTDLWDNEHLMPADTQSFDGEMESPHEAAGGDDGEELPIEREMESHPDFIPTESELAQKALDEEDAEAAPVTVGSSGPDVIEWSTKETKEGKIARLQGLNGVDDELQGTASVAQIPRIDPRDLSNETRGSSSTAGQWQPPIRIATSGAQSPPTGMRFTSAVNVQPIHIDE